MNSMIFGYARVSTRDQNLETQITELEKAGVPKENIYHEKISGRITNRPEFSKLFDKMRTGDTLIVCDLDRLGRTTKQLFELMEYFMEQNIALKSINQGMFDTSSPMGKAIFQIIAILKEMEVEVTRERSRKAIQDRIAKGVKVGRKEGSIQESKYHSVIGAYNAGKTWSEIQKITGASRGSISNYLKRAGMKE